MREERDVGALDGLFARSYARNRIRNLLIFADSFERRQERALELSPKGTTRLVLHARRSRTGSHPNRRPRSRTAHAPDPVNEPCRLHDASVETLLAFPVPRLAGVAMTGVIVRCRAALNSATPMRPSCFGTSYLMEDALTSHIVMGRNGQLNETFTKP